MDTNDKQQIEYNKKKLNENVPSSFGVRAPHYYNRASSFNVFVGIFYYRLQVVSSTIQHECMITFFVRQCIQSLSRWHFNIRLIEDNANNNAFVNNRTTIKWTKNEDCRLHISLARCISACLLNAKMNVRCTKNEFIFATKNEPYHSSVVLDLNESFVTGAWNSFSSFFCAFFSLSTVNWTVAHNCNADESWISCYRMPQYGTELFPSRLWLISTSFSIRL